MISSVLVVGNRSPDAARHPMTSFAGKTLSSTILNKSFSIMVDATQTAARTQSRCATALMVAENLNPMAARCVDGMEMQWRWIWMRIVAIRGGAGTLKRSVAWKLEDEEAHEMKT